MKRLHLIMMMLGIVMLSSCARSCQSLDRDIMDNHKQDVRISQYSGGRLIGVWEINGIVSNSQNSDGYFFYDNKGRLVEISGDIRLQYDYKSTDSISWKQY